MMHLIFSEIKKILKNKLNLFVILAMIIGLGIVSYLNLSPEDIPVYRDQTPIVLKTFDGKELKNIEEVKAYKHEILSKYHKQADASLWEQYKKDYNNYYKEFTKQYNDAMMKKTYGKDYQDIFKQIKGQVSEEDAMKYMEMESKSPYSISPSSISAYNAETKTVILPAFYEKQGELYMLNYIYRGSYDASYVSQAQGSGEAFLTDADEFIQNPLYYMSHKDKLEESALSSIEMKNSALKTLNLNQIKQTIKNNDFVFGDTSDMEQFIQLLTKFTFFTLLVSAIVLANSFSIENHNKTDQVIVPSKTGYKNITIAKLTAGFLVAFTTALLQFLVVLIIANQKLNLDGWDCSMTKEIFLSVYSYKEYTLLFIGLLLLATFVISMLTMALSFFTKNQFITIIIMFLFIMTPYFAPLFLPVDILRFTPSIMLEPNHYLIPYVYYGFPYLSVFSHAIMWKTFIAMFWLLCGVIIIATMLVKAKRHYVENR